MMKKTLYLGAFLVTVCLFGHTPPVNAATFDPGIIIDDAVFTNYTSMNVANIQSFLNSKVPSCDTNGTQPASDFGRPDLTHAQYAALKGWQAPPYTCLRDYTENGKSAAQVIYDVSQQYHINPQVFIVLLQKETGLVTDTWPLAWQYRTATGYGCPDSTPGVCDATYNGYTNQVSWAGRLYRSVLNQSPTWYSPYVKGWNYIQWSPTASCGGSMVNVLNWSTAALYDYTPYQPNAAALAAGYGRGDSCSAYGNRNFFLYFTEWFGDPTFVMKDWTYNNTYLVLSSGDFNGDGKMDIAAMYDYGNNQVRLWTFYGTATGFSSPTIAWDSGTGNWGWGSTKLSSGDFNGDGKMDIAAMYDYGNNQVRLWTFYGTATGFSSPTMIY
ncbi:MAG: VCBS repeat-containing protein [Candidatus Saccharimonas aalborgensis]